MNHTNGALFNVPSCIQAKVLCYCARRTGKEYPWPGPLFSSPGPRKEKPYNAEEGLRITSNLPGRYSSGYASWEDRLTPHRSNCSYELVEGTGHGCQKPRVPEPGSSQERASQKAQLWVWVQDDWLRTVRLQRCCTGDNPYWRSISAVMWPK